MVLAMVVELLAKTFAKRQMARRDVKDFKRFAGFRPPSATQLPPFGLCIRNFSCAIHGPSPRLQMPQLHFSTANAVAGHRKTGVETKHQHLQNATQLCV
jgi:hypothetical protein